MTDLMDERLAAASRSWQAQQPPPPGVPLERLDERLPGPIRSRGVLAAAAAVVVVGGGALAVGHLGSDGTVASPSSPATHRVTPSRGATVPWADLPAGHPQVRTTLAPAGNGQPAQVVTPFDRVSASGTIRGHARPGDTIVFTAVLESSTDLPLDPCPDYTIAFGTTAQTRQLNCSAVPYRGAKGRPYLPAFTNVRFEMQVTVPDTPGRQKVLWTLDGPQRLPGFYGLVDVQKSGG